MAYIIRVYYGDKIYSVDLSMQREATIGSGGNDTVRLDARGLSENHVSIGIFNNVWMIKTKKKLYRENSRISAENLFAGVTYQLRTEPPIFIAIHPKQNDTDKIVKLDMGCEINIGRDKTNDIVFSNMRTSSRHCKIYNEDGVYKIQDCGSRNGTFVNTKRITEKILYDGDIINFSIYQMIFENNALSFRNVGNDVIYNLKALEKQDDDYINNKRRDTGTISLFGNNNDDNDDDKKGTVSVFDL